MKRPPSLLFCLSLLLLTFLCTRVRAQESTIERAESAAERTASWGPALVGGARDNFAVTPSGQIWCATATGHLWHADGPGGNWTDRYFGEDEFDGE